MTAAKPAELVPLLLTAAHVAQLLGCSKPYAYKLMQHGRLPVVRIGDRAVRVRRTDLEKFIARNTIAAIIEPDKESE